jgi:hypothetical protein
MRRVGPISRIVQYTAQAMMGICMRRQRESCGSGMFAGAFAISPPAGAVDFPSVSTAL